MPLVGVIEDALQERAGAPIIQHGSLRELNTRHSERVVHSDADGGPRYGCLIVGGFWLGMIVLLWIPPAFALAWAVIGLTFTVRPHAVASKLNAGSKFSMRSRTVRWLTAIYRSPVMIRVLGIVVLNVVAVGVLAETNVILEN